MHVTLFSAKRFDRDFLGPLAEKHRHEVRFLEARFDEHTAPLAAGSRCACLFVNDLAGEPALTKLAEAGVELLALRSAGFNHVDLEAAGRLGLAVARVPAYSPFAVAEHAAALLLSLNRKVHKAYNRVREGNFSIDGLMGFDLHGKTVGVVGTGKIGLCFARIALGFGCRVLAYDVKPSDEARALGVTYAGLDEILRGSDIISLHCPLTPQTHHLINAESLAKARPGFMLINTSRGGLVDTKAVIDGLKSGRVGALGIDVYEEESDFFFRDLSERVLQDDQLARLLTFPNVLVTSHQAFFTREAVENIAATTIENITAFEKGGATGLPGANVVEATRHAGPRA